MKFIIPASYSFLEVFRSGVFGKILSFSMIGLLMLQMSGCYYYKAVQSNEPPINILADIHNGNYYMLHIGDEAWQLGELILSEESVKTKLLPVTGHEYYTNTKYDQANRYRKNAKIKQSEVLNEVHIYASGYAELDSGLVEIPFENFESVILYDEATGAVIASWTILAAGGVTLAAFGVTLAAILVLTPTSCPFIYVFDGEQYQFAGEIYGGSIYSSLERDDYIPLIELKEKDDFYNLVLANELPEIQNTNLAELLYVDHQAGMTVLFDKNGNLQTINNPTKASSVTNLKGVDVKNELLMKDSLVYYGADLNADPEMVDGIIIEAVKPANADEMKIVVSARNSFWLEYVYKNFHELLGTKYKDYSGKNSDLSREELIQKMIDQQLPISVYLEKDGQWMFMDYFNMVGPVTFKDDVLSLDVSDLPSGPVKVKLEYGSYFWELDYAALDFSENPELTIGEIPVFSAIDESGRDISQLLSSDDMLYYVQPEKGNAADIRFSVPEMTNESRSLFLHSKGYYTILRDPQGVPDNKKLQELKKGDGLPQYSLELLLEFQKQNSTGAIK